MRTSKTEMTWQVPVFKIYKSVHDIVEKVKYQVFFTSFVRHCEAHKKVNWVLNPVTFSVTIPFVIQCSLLLAMFGDVGETDTIL